MKRSGSGASASASSRPSDSSSIAAGSRVPARTRSASRRAACAMSQRPPYDSAMYSVRFGFAAVSASAFVISARRSGLSVARSPMKRTRMPLRCSCSISRSIASTNSSMRRATSSAGRPQFSLENANSVSASTPRRAQPSTIARTALTPALWPTCRGIARREAQRPLPSMMTATWRGVPGARVGGCATGSDLHQFLFFLRDDVVHLGHVLVGELLDVVVGTAVVVLGDHLLLEHLLELLHHVAAHVADRDTRVLALVAHDLAELAAALLGECRQRHADHVARGGRVQS